MHKFFMIICLLSAISLFPQNENTISLTGNLKVDSRIILSDYNSAPEININLKNSEHKKSPLLAGLFSVLIPGAGEFYAESYYKAVLFAALEASLITVAVIYDNKGDDKTSEFENYADNVTDKSGWSVVRYAQWINQHKGKNISINPNTNLKPWERVNWTELNAIERQISGFSHTLANYGEQQYYEMIGKYHQFSPGWWDFSGGSNNFDISPSYAYYSGLRGEANDLYNISTKAVVFIYINHFLSALDAIWSAVSFNKNLNLNVRMDHVQISDRSDLYPSFYLKYNF